MVSQNYCYILIIPGFGIVSHIISTFSGKSIFGQYGSKYYNNILKHTICRKVSIYFFSNRSKNRSKQNTILYSHPLLILLIISSGASIFTFFVNIIKIMVIMFVLSYNPQITKTRILLFLSWIQTLKYKILKLMIWNLSMLVGISEAIRVLFIYFLSYLIISTHILGIKLLKFKKYHFNRYYSNYNDDLIFNQWLAGFIDGDGCFLLSKKGYASLEIISHIRDKNCLYQIKNKCGGSLKLRSNLNHLRYRLHNKEGLLNLINRVNGEIRNPVRLLQLNRLCGKYCIELIQPAPLTYLNGWFSGFFDSDGSVYLSLLSSQMFITASQKNKFMLDFICELYGGSVYVEKTSFKWYLSKKSEVIKLLDYFLTCPCRSAKIHRIKAINKYYELKTLKAHLATDNSILGLIWKKFLNKWDKWEKIDK